MRICGNGIKADGTLILNHTDLHRSATLAFDLALGGIHQHHLTSHIALGKVNIGNYLQIRRITLLT